MIYKCGTALNLLKFAPLFENEVLFPFVFFLFLRKLHGSSKVIVFYSRNSQSFF